MARYMGVRSLNWNFLNEKGYTRIDPPNIHGVYKIADDYYERLKCAMLNDDWVRPYYIEFCHNIFGEGV